MVAVTCLSEVASLMSRDQQALDEPKGWLRHRRISMDVKAVACVRVADGIEDALSAIAMMDIKVDNRHTPDVLALRPTTDA